MLVELGTKFLDNINLAKANALVAADRRKRGLEPAAPQSRVDIGCASIAGLSIRITKRADRKVWSLTYTSPVTKRLKRETLGVYGKEENGAVSVRLAHERVRDLKEGIHNKIDPQIARLAAAPSKTFGEVMEARLARDVFGMCKGADDIALRYRTSFAKLLALPIKDFKIDPHYNDLIKGHEARKQRRSIEKIRSDLSVIFDFAKEKSFVDFNPIPKRKRGAKATKGRARALSPAEIVKLWRALDGGALEPHMVLILKLMICLGQRCGEICGMRDSEITEHSPTDWVWTIPGDDRDPQTGALLKAGRTKNGKYHAVPLSALAIELVKEARALANGRDEFFATLYRGQRKSTDTQNVGAALWFARNRMAVDPFGIGDWTVHMLRHTVVTGMTELGIADGHISKVVNHAMAEATAEQKAASGWGSAVTKGYTHQTAVLAARELKAKREALDLWGETVDGLLNPPKLKLVA